MVAVNYIVNWVDPEVGVSFRVKDTFAVPVVLATVGPAVFSATISLDSLAEHQIKVVPFNGAGESPASTGVAVHAALPTLAPAMVVVTQL